MSFRYCDNCSCGLPAPTPYEDLGEGQECPKCETCQEQFFTTEEWVVMLWDMIQELKEGK